MEIKETVNKRIIIGIASLLILLITIVGTTFGYFVLTINSSGVQSVVIDTAQLSVSYYQGNYIQTGTNVIPGWQESYSFSIENTSTIPIYYSISWINVTNTFTNRNDFVYTYTSNNGGATGGPTPCPTATSIFVSSRPLAVNTTHTYTMQLHFIDSSSNQNVDQGKTFSGTIEVTVDNMSHVS